MGLGVGVGVGVGVVVGGLVLHCGARAGGSWSDRDTAMWPA